MKTKNYLLLPVLAIAAAFSSCEKDTNTVTNPAPANEEELITTVRLVVFDGTDSLAFEFKDLDGEGGNSGSIDTIVLSSSNTYLYSVEFLDESKNPVVDITEEILEEGDEHLVCYNSTNGLDISRGDLDENNLPIGTVGTLITNNAGNGTLTITLKHQPGVKNGQCEPGETDIEVVFPVRVQ